MSTDQLPPGEQDEHGELRTEVGQSLVLLGMLAILIVAALLFGLAF